MRDLRLCTLLRYDKLRMKKKIWENGCEAGSSRQISLPRLSSPSDHSSARFFSCSSSYCTHIPSGRTSSHETFVKTCVLAVQSLECLVHALPLIRFVFFSNFPQAFLFISFYKIMFFSPPPSAPQILTLGSKLTWAPSAIFSLSTSLSLCWSGELKRRPHSTQYSFPLAKHGQKKVQPGSPHPCPACYSCTVHAATPDTCGGLWVEVEKCEYSRLRDW